MPGSAMIKKAAISTLQRWRMASTTWRFTAAAGVLVLVAAAGYLALTLTKAPPRARQYLDFKACLLTDAQGITGRQAAPIWAEMGQASLKTRARIQYLPIFGPPTVPNALPYLASLTQRHCNIIVATGRIPATTISGAAARYPRIRFIAIGANGTARNLTTLNTDDAQAPATVKRLIINAAKNAA
jgi:hypothetical protein